MRGPGSRFASSSGGRRPPPARSASCSRNSARARCFRRSRTWRSSSRPSTRASTSSHARRECCAAGLSWKAPGPAQAHERPASHAGEARSRRGAPRVSTWMPSFPRSSRGFAAFHCLRPSPCPSSAGKPQCHWRLCGSASLLPHALPFACVARGAAILEMRPTRGRTRHRARPDGRSRCPRLSRRRRFTRSADPIHWIFEAVWKAGPEYGNRRRR